MRTSLGNGSIAHCRPSSQPLLGVKLGFTSEAVDSKICAHVTGAVHFSNSFSFGRRQLTVPNCARVSLTSRRRNPLGNIKIEKDMFEDTANAENHKSGTDEIQEDEEEVYLVPRQWRLAQDDLYKTRIERKLDVRLQARENELRRAEQLQLKRQQLEAAGKALKERNRKRNQEKGVDSFCKKEDSASLISTAIPVASRMEEADELSQAHNSPNEEKFELDRLFSEDEIACLKRGAPDLIKLDCKKWLPLHVLVATGQFFFLEEYLKSELDLNAVDEDGYTPIHRAILGRKETAATQLLRAGADPFVLDMDGASFLHYSVQTGSLNLVRLFVKYGVDMNHPDQDGWTALHVAILTSREDIVRHLLFNGADTHRKTKDGHTPFDLCLAVGKGYRTFAVAKNLRRLSKTGNNTFGIESQIQEDSTADE